MGCNSDSITLWGHSAGAGDINILALSPYSNHLFQRAIIQSGTAFSYWSYDKFHVDRYKAYKAYFNCTNLPEKVTSENKAMNLLIKNCLLSVSLEKLFEFRYALIDSPGPINDDFLDDKNRIMNGSPREMMLKNFENFEKINILTGINRVEGFSFEGYFSTSIKSWHKNSNVLELPLTLERYSLLTRDKCIQNSIIGNRLKFEDYYQNKIKKPDSFGQMGKIWHQSEKNNFNTYSAKLKSIFANSDAIFDAGFIGFLNTYYNLKKETNNKNDGLYVYEYLHENLANKGNLNQLKSYLKESLIMSTHFDGIDFAFGLPIAYKLNNKTKSFRSKIKERPFENFIFDSGFNEQDIRLSKIVMTYFTNFIKNGYFFCLFNID